MKKSKMVVTLALLTSVGLVGCQKNDTAKLNELQKSIEEKDKKISELTEKLKEAGVPTAVHYPMPLHLQECFKYLGYKSGDFPIAEMISNEIMSLPMNPYLKDVEIEFIVENLK